MCVDLHIHSIYSDGTFTPEELINEAHRLKLRAVSVTDHDTVAGTREALHYGGKTGMTVIPGLEVSAMHRDISLHLLGYGIDPEHAELGKWLLRLQQGRNTRNLDIFKKLRKLGLNVEIDELRRFSSCGQIGRPHIARLLMQKGVAKDMNQAFRLYLRRGAPAWVKRFTYSAAETIAAIHRAGGLAVLAHPGQIDPGMKVQPRLIYELAEYGLDGLEVYYPGHPRSIQKQLLELARKYRLIVTGGSDFHGADRAANALAGGKNGFCPPDDIILNINEKIAENRHVKLRP